MTTDILEDRSKESTTLDYFLAVGAGCWGRDKRLRGAIKKAVTLGGSDVKWSLWKVPGDAWVDGMGYIRCNGDVDPVPIGAFNSRYVALDWKQVE